MNTPVSRPLGSARIPRRRRGILASLSALLLVGALAACTAQGGGESPAKAQPSKQIEFTYAGYSTKLPAEPKRVVVLDSRAGLEMALLADYPIVATAYNDESPLAPLVDAKAAHLKNSAFELNREEVASYKPDLIVVGAAWLGVYKEQGLNLDRIAPVLAVKESGDTPGGDQFAVMVDQLKILDRSSQADKVVKGYRDAVETAKKKLGADMQGATISVIHVTTEGFTVITEEDTYQNVLPDLGFKILDNEVIQSAPPAPSGMNHALSYENAVSALKDADLIVIYKAEKGMKLDPMLEKVPAVAKGRWIEGNLAERVGFALTHTSLVNSITAGVTGFPRS